MDGLRRNGVDRSSPQTNELIDSVETEMVDLSDVLIDELRTGLVEPLEPYANRVMTSIGRPRTNLGGSGPPGRDD